MNMPSGIGIDMGTTGTKAVLFDNNGKLLSSAYEAYTIASPEPGFREQDPSLHLNAVINTLSQVVQKARELNVEIAFVSFSVMMHGMFPVDDSGKPIASCMLWNDARSAAYVKADRESGLGLSQYLRTGTPCHPMAPFYKVLWLRDNMPSVFERAAKFISVKEYVFHEFFNEYIIDYSVASATGMFNVKELDWDRQALERLGIGKDKLSKTVDTTYTLSCADMDETIRERIGLSKNVKFVIGASDGCLSNLGSQAIAPGEAAISIGTSGAVRVVSEKPVIDSAGRVFCYYLTKNKYVIGGATNSGGIVYRWLRDLFPDTREMVMNQGTNDYARLGDSGYERLNRFVEQTPAGSRGLLFLPFLFGERAPYWNSALRAAFIGLTEAHGLPEMARAVIEGVCLSISNVFHTINDLAFSVLPSGSVNSIHADGGFARCEEWVRVLCDCLDTPLYIVKDALGPIAGAYYIGLLACGYVDKLEDTNDIFSNNPTPYMPRIENKEVYLALLRLFRQSTESLTPVLEELGRLS